MRSLTLIPISLVLGVLASPSFATNRCVTPDGRALYTDEACDRMGAKFQHEVTAPISVVPALPVASSPARPKSTEAKFTAPKKIFQKSPQAPVLTVCYDPKDARTDVSSNDIESAIQNAFALWNAGCNINYQYLGLCSTAVVRSTNDRPPDYKVWWAIWDETMMGRGNGDSLIGARDNAIAAASPNVGVALNRDIAGFPRQFRRAIIHEFGHVVGVGHSPDPKDLMYSGGRADVPTDHDLDMCNQAIETRFGVKRLE